MISPERERSVINHPSQNQNSLVSRLEDRPDESSLLLRCRLVWLYLEGIRCHVLRCMLTEFFINESLGIISTGFDHVNQELLVRQ